MKRLLLTVCVVFLSVSALADEPKNLLKPVDKEASWRLEMVQGGAGKLEIVDGAAVYKVSKVTGTDWHVQAFQVDLDLKDGKEYTLKMRLASPQARRVNVVAMIDKDDWHEIGLHETINLTQDPKPYEFTFRASGTVEKKNRVGFVLGDETGDLIVKEMTLTEKKP